MRNRRRVRDTRGLCAATLLILCWIAWPWELVHAAGPELDAALNVRALRGARVAALVLRARDGEVLYARQPDMQLAPASNQKVLTAVAALAAYGPSHRFTTTVLTDGAPDDDGRVGAIWIRGGGDPALTSEDWWRLGADLRRRGLRRIDGDIVVDDAAFDAERWNPGWGAATARAYYPAVGALMANYGSFTVEVRPGARTGDPLRVAIDPAIPYLALDNTGKTAARGGAAALAVERETSAGSERVIVSGTLAVDAAPQVIYRSVLEPALYAGALLRLQLAANDITVGGSVRRGATPATAQPLLSFQGKSVTEIVRLLMKYSNNGIAESLCKGFGVEGSIGQGSWPTGLAAMRRHLGNAGVDVSAFVLVDGSGLSPSNRVSPRGLVTALRVARESFAFGPDLIAALPIAGLDGTLQQRGSTVRAKVRAKTGLLAGAVGLSGYAQLVDGETAIFSVLVNAYDGADADVIAAVDGFVTALVQSSARSTAAREDAAAHQ